MEETLYFAEQLSRRALTKAEMEKIKELVETYSKNPVQDALEKTFQMTGKLFLEYAETILKAKAKMPDKEQIGEEKMKTMKDYFEMLKDNEKRDCVGILGSVDYDEVITWVLQSHADELTLEEYSTLKMLALESGKARALSNIEYILAETNGIDVN